MTGGDVTTFLNRLANEDAQAVDELLPVLYDELRRLARYHLSQERVDHTLQPTALVHEAYLKLVDQSRVDWRGHGHFLAVASLAMRRLLVDHARKHRSQRRGGDLQKLELEAAMSLHGEHTSDEILAIDQLLETLATFDPRAARVVECRFFVGLSIEETATALGLSPMTVKRSWRVAYAWLRRELGEAGGPLV